LKQIQQTLGENSLAISQYVLVKTKINNISLVKEC